MMRYINLHYIRHVISVRNRVSISVRDGFDLEFSGLSVSVI